MSQNLDGMDFEDVTDEDIATVEIGQTGLRRPAGYIQEDYSVSLRGKRGAETYTRMSNDETVGAVLFAIEQLISQVNFEIEAASESQEDEDKATFVSECFADMQRPWKETLSEILSMLRYGWSYHEVVFKVRGGPNSRDIRFRSAYDDGLIGWRKFAIRGQDSLLRWEYQSADIDEIEGLWQIPAPSYKEVFIPIEKSLLFRPKSHKDNPEGRSILRSAYRAWYFKENIQKIEGIGIERDLAGLPVMYAPARIFNADASPADKAQFANCKKIVRNIRVDEQMGLVLPAAYDNNNNKLFDLQLLSTGGSKQVNTNEVINRYDQRIAMSMLADFVLLGHQGVGSYSLADSKTSIFTMAIKSWLDSIVDVINRQAIPMLFRVNGWPLEGLPTMTYGDIEDIDIAKLASYITSLANAGMPLFPNDELERYLRDVAGMPHPTSFGEVGENRVEESEPTSPQEEEETVINPDEELGE
jgi:hypothetical protein